MGGHIVDPEYLNSVRCESQGDTDGPESAVDVFAPEQFRNKTFSRVADQDRALQVMENRGRSNQFQIVLVSFPKADTWV